MIFFIQIKYLSSEYRTSIKQSNAATTWIFISLQVALYLQTLIDAN